MACQDLTCFQMISYAIGVVFGKSPRPSPSGGISLKLSRSHMVKPHQACAANGLLLHAYKVTDSRVRTNKVFDLGIKISSTMLDDRSHRVNF
jgi:hypothetical protein